jgi:SAM-dependent methyltransferase
MVPLVLEIVGPVRSVVDVGCGLGTWPRAFNESGIADAWGIDGSHVDSARLLIPVDKFLKRDLSQPLKLDRQFDLVVSLEVAEHLPSDAAETLVESLTRLGSLVLFSAAIPFQGGTKHLNEQWPQYWSKIFEEKGFSLIDCIRRKVWGNPRVQPCYAQNTLLFVKTADLANYPSLKAEMGSTKKHQLSVVHPEIYLGVADPRNACFRDALWFLLAVTKRAVKNRTMHFFVKS